LPISFAALPPYYDLVIIDIRMPRVNGLQLYNRFKAISPDIKVLLVSALDISQELVSIQSDMNLAYNILKKPVEREKFLCIVRRILTTSS
jgi:DNA-binding NtrC family response regulator